MANGVRLRASLSAQHRIYQRSCRELSAFVSYGTLPTCQLSQITDEQPLSDRKTKRNMEEISTEYHTDERMSRSRDIKNAMCLSESLRHTDTPSFLNYACFIDRDSIRNTSTQESFLENWKFLEILRNLQRLIQNTYVWNSEWWGSADDPITVSSMQIGFK